MQYSGLLEVRLDAVGSKSEGRYAHLLLPDEQDFILYREGCLAVNDEFFEPYSGHQVIVEGEEETRARHILVESIMITQ